jgi:hypothetical protein
MSATGFLSVWISNTATATMIYPIVISIVEQLVILNPEFSHDDDANSGDYQSDGTILEQFFFT